MASHRYLLYVFILSSVMPTVMNFTFFFGDQQPKGTLVHRDKVKYEAIPFKKRVTTYAYNATSKPIKSIHCYDYQNSEASVNITNGGVGFKFVELRLKSQRSYRLDYAIEIYA